MEKTKLWSLEAEDATHLGGPMGTEYTTHLWTKVFTSPEKAKAYAEKFSKRKPGELQWSRNRKELSVDAGAWIFTIRQLEIES